jgi:uncharacterized membrane protein
MSVVERGEIPGRKRMTLALFVMIFACVGISALAQLAMKVGMSEGAIQRGLGAGAYADVFLTVARNPLVMGGLIAYVLGAGLWLFVLSKAELSLVYPFVGMGFILTMLFGSLFLNEHVGLFRVVGTLLIAAGAFLVARS